MNRAIHTLSLRNRHSWSSVLLLTLSVAGLGAPAVARAQCDLSFAETPPAFDAVAPQYGLAAGDFNHDCRMDIAAGVTSGHVSILIGVGDGTFLAPTTYPYTPPSRYSVTTGDFDRDGQLDLAVATDESGASILLGNPDGTFQPVVSYIAGPHARFVATADLNRDDILDLAVANNGGDSLGVLLGNGDGTFQPVVSYPTGSRIDCVVIGDFGGDDTPYLVLGGEQHIESWRSDAFGNLQALGSFAIHPGGFGRLSSLAVGDFDRDGRLDLGIPDGTVVILIGNGDGTFHGGDDIAAGPGPSGIVAADLNADGLLDLAVTPSCCSSDVSILRGNGDGHFQPAETFTAAASGLLGSSLVVADFDGDGRPDLAEGGGLDNSVRVLMNTGCGSITSLRGTVDTGAGGAGPSDTLLTNGTSNSDCYTHEVSAAVGATLSIVESPSRLALGARYAVYVWTVWPSPGTDQILPRGIGTMKMHTPIPPVSGLQPVRVANNIGRDSQLGSENWPGPATQPAPYTLLNLPPGALVPRIGRHLYFQAIERDDRSAGTVPYSVTNGQRWLIVP